MATATTFHLFPLLLWEPRAQIWELTITPRTAEVQILDNNPQDHLELLIPSPFSSSNSPPHRRLPRLFSPTPVPAVLHACHEARKHLTELSPAHRFYERAFEDLALPGTESRSESSISNTNASSSNSFTNNAKSHANLTFY